MGTRTDLQSKGWIFSLPGYRQVLPLYWVILSALILAADYFTGPFVRFPILYVIPVSLASWYSGRQWGFALAIIMPIVRLYFTLLWRIPWSMAGEVASTVTAEVVLLFAALVLDRLGAQVIELEEARDEQATSRDNLERRVEERTSEIRRVNEELQTDILKRQEVENALRKSEERYRTVADFTYDWEFWIGNDRRFEYVSPSCERISGYSADEFLKDPILLEMIVYPDDRPVFVYEEEFDTDKAFDYDFRITSKAGDVRWIHHTCRLVRGADGTRLGRRASNRDVTERRKVEEALRESETKYSALVEQAMDGIMIIQEEKTKFANEALAKTFGYSTEELVNAEIAELVAPAYRDSFVEQYRKRIAGETAAGLYETKGMRKDGTLIDLEISAGQIEYEGRPAVMSFVRDITQRKKMEDEFLRMNKLESIGILAGGIAHDFNNILTAILGNISFAQMLTRPGEKVYKLLSEAEKASLRAKDLTTKLITFARGGAPIRKALQIPELIKDSVRATPAHPKVIYQFNFAGDILPVEVDEGQMRHVLKNIIINANEAMPEGGRIEISAENVIIETEADRGDLPLSERAYVKISIRDEGVGIPPERISSIFDPYVSTKQEGRGLGLATAYSVIKKHKGHIGVESTVGVGTVFSIYLPASTRKSDE